MTAKVGLCLGEQRNGPDHILQWPRQLFAREAAALLDGRAPLTPDWADQVELLLSEAFGSDQPVQDFHVADCVPRAVMDPR